MTKFINTEAPDVKIGGAGNDEFLIQIGFGGGNDRFFGEGGGDFAQGGIGDDKLFGGADNDALYGGDGDDKLYGEAGNDFIDTGTGIDFVDAGSGDDTINISSQGCTVNGGAGNDRMVCLEAYGLVHLDLNLESQFRVSFGSIDEF